MKLNSQGMQILIGELQQNEMCAIYLMGLGKEMTDCITKLDLTRIISILCKKLNWIEVEEDWSLENWFNKDVITAIENNSDYSTDISFTHSSTVAENGSGENSFSVQSSPKQISKMESEEQDVGEGQLNEEIPDTLPIKAPNLNAETTEMLDKTDDQQLSSSECDKIFENLGALERHKNDSTCDKSFRCSSCDYVAKNAYSLKQHERSCSEKPFGCSFCDYRCTLKKSLKQHEKIHTGDKSFSCSHCGKKFRLMSHLRMHERPVRGGGKLLRCSK